MKKSYLKRGISQMKRTPLKRGTSQLKRSPLKQGTVTLKRTHLNRGHNTLKRTKLRVRGISDTSVLKEQIQTLLRQIVIKRDGGCILRDYIVETGSCGGRRKDGELILQAEHLHTRSNSASFADHRLVVCLCQRHHGFYKPQMPDQYYRIVKKIIGPKRTKLLKDVQDDRSPHKMDWKIEKLALEDYLKTPVDKPVDNSL